MYCPSCGTQVPDTATACPHCARELEPAAGDELDGVATIAAATPAAGSGTPEIAPGSLFHERYAIEGTVGRGGMGVVYRARDNVTDETVCLKVIRPELVADSTLAGRFLREGRLSRGLRHPSIVAVYDVNVAEGIHYISMEHLEGSSLREWLLQNLRERRTVPVRTAVKILESILDGLAAAHDAGVVHRDLKPENIVLSADPLASDSWRLKILDFGIARALEGDERLTVSGAALGTPVYMAPEQETGADAVGPEADLYSAGAIFYEVLLGVAPRGRWELPSRIRNDVTAELDRVCEKALESHPARRFSTARDFRAALDKAVTSPLPNRLEAQGGRSALGAGEKKPSWGSALESLRPAAGATWPKTRGQWITMSAIPCLAWIGWIAVWWRTRKKQHLVWGLVYMIPLVFAALISEELSAENVEYYTDMWGNILPQATSEASEEVVGGSALIIFGFWVIALAHAAKAWPQVSGTPPVDSAHEPRG